MSTFQPGSNYKRRRFQGTGFGMDRDLSAGDSLPIWKKQMFNRIRNKSKQNRQCLLQRLEQQKISNLNLSPNSKKQNAHNTIDSFKKSLVEHEIKMQFNNININNNNNNQNNNNPHFNEQDTETRHLTNEQYKVIFAELERYLEETELSDLRQSYVASMEEIEKDQENAAFEEIMASDAVNDPHVVYCPVCCKHSMIIEYINGNQPVYGCLCGIKFQPRDKKVSIPKKMEKTKNGKGDDIDIDIDIDIDVLSDNKENNWCNESDVDVGRRMLKTLKNNISSLMGYHSEQLHCKNQLNFAVIEESGFLQSWCTQCNCNEIVI